MTFSWISLLTYEYERVPDAAKKEEGKSIWRYFLWQNKNQQNICLYRL